MHPNAEKLEQVHRRLKEIDSEAADVVLATCERLQKVSQELILLLTTLRMFSNEVPKFGLAVSKEELSNLLKRITEEVDKITMLAAHRYTCLYEISEEDKTCTCGLLSFMESTK